MRSLKPILVTLLITFCSHIVFSQTDEAAQRIKRFYAFYITEQDGIPDKKKMNDTLNHYITAAYLKKMRSEKDIEADQVLNVQDFDKNWVKSLTVTKVNGKPNMYKVCIFDSYSKENHCVIVSLEKEAGLWKIDKITY